MKKFLSICAASLLAASCTPVTQNAPTSGNPTKITWIEDKPGPTLQGHKIFPSVPDSLWAALNLQDGVPSSISCFLLQTSGNGNNAVDILLDAGLGAPFSQLMPKLQEAGISADSLKYIFISHMHPDHIGGLLTNGQKTFPNAELWINQIEAEAWENMENSKAELPHAVLAAYKDNLHMFQAGDTLIGGVTTMAAYGHTPGHTVFQKDSILIIADLLHGAALQLDHPEYCPFFDMDPEAATEARKRILNYARQNNLTMYGMHLPAPGYLK